LRDGSIIHGVRDAHHQIRVPGASCGETDKPIPNEEVERRPDNVQREFPKNLSSYERCPTIHPAGAFAKFINAPRLEEGNLDLVGQGCAHDQTHEDGLFTHASERRTDGGRIASKLTKILF
jgi:hypothetical protein